jgi:hypothetical protein
MAIIKHPKTQLSKTGLHSRDHFIFITNWRLVGTLNNNEQIDIINAACDRFIVHMSFEEFKKAIIKGQAEAVYQFVNIALSCSTCKGRGKLDWISKITQKVDNNRYTQKSVSYYKRNKNRINEVTPIKSIWPVEKLYASEPNLLEGQELCPVCKGTGLFMMKNSDIIKSIDV